MKKTIDLGNQVLDTEEEMSNKSPMCTNCFHSKEKHHFYTGQKDNDHHCKEFGCKRIQYFEK